MDKPNGRTLGAVILIGLGLLTVFSVYQLKRLRIPAALRPGVPIPVLLKRRGDKELELPVPRGRARIRQTARWVWVNQDQASKRVRLADFVRDGRHQENPLERLPEEDVPGSRAVLIEVPVRADATRGRYTYDIYVDDRRATDPEIMIET